MINFSNETNEEEEEMNISQEILVLDFGDDKNHDYLRSDPSTEFGSGKCLFLHFKHFFINQPFILDKTVTIIEPCPTKTSVLALAVTCALMVLVYLSTLFCYYMKKWMQPHKVMA